MKEDTYKTEKGDVDRDKSSIMANNTASFTFILRHKLMQCAYKVTQYNRGVAVLLLSRSYNKLLFPPDV